MLVEKGLVEGDKEKVGQLEEDVKGEGEEEGEESVDTLAVAEGSEVELAPTPKDGEVVKLLTSLVVRVGVKAEEGVGGILRPFEAVGVVLRVGDKVAVREGVLRALLVLRMLRLGKGLSVKASLVVGLDLTLTLQVPQEDPEGVEA